MRLLFAPVSAPMGMGEYARAREIAAAVARRWPQAQIHFLVSREAPYANAVPFPATLLPSSPTFHPKEVAQVMREFRPDVVIFDNAGRTSQLRAAHDLGARVVFVSSRARQRRKAFRLRWMRLIDEHWIAYPQFVAGALTGIERLKLRLLNRPAVRYLDTILPEPQPHEAAATLARFDLQPDSFVLVVPGGGTAHPGAANAPQVMTEAAERLAALGHATLLIGANAPSRAQSLPLLRHTARVSMSELTALLRNARLVICNGGDTLLQAIACSRPCVAAAIAHDQASRIARCEAAGLVTGARLDAGELERAALSLICDEHRRAAQLIQMARHPLTNGLGTAVESIERLVAD
jgi:spore coat polysaccharide biosynthesis predicted glycosyltransferase SpsG